jgi:hypothetical protein
MFDGALEDGERYDGGDRGVHGRQWGKRARRGLAGELRSGQLLLLRKWKEFEDSGLLADGEGCGVEFDRAGGGRTDRRRDKGGGWAWRGAVMPLESRRCGFWKLADCATKWCSDGPICSCVWRAYRADVKEKDSQYSHSPLALF